MPQNERLALVAANWHGHLRRAAYEAEKGLTKEELRQKHIAEEQEAHGEQASKEKARTALYIVEG